MCFICVKPVRICSRLLKNYDGAVEKIAWTQVVPSLEQSLFYKYFVWMSQKSFGFYVYFWLHRWRLGNRDAFIIHDDIT